MELKQSEHFKKWIKKLPQNVKDKVNEYISRVLEGKTSSCKALRDGISEIKINYQKGYRVFYIVLKNNEFLFLLGGSDKSGNQKRQNEAIQRAIDLKNSLKKDGEL